MGTRGLVPPFTGRLHCGLRRYGRAVEADLLVPPFTGRLHCGADDLLDGLERTDDSYRPSPGGSIAAPVRDGSGIGRAYLVPPFTGRLHCGLAI